LSAALVGSIQKTYDGNTDATLANGNFSISGFVTVSGVSEATSVTKTLGTYNSRNVLQANNVTTALLASDFSANAGTSLSNYTLPTQASGAGSIGVRTLVVNYTGQDKVYDGNTIASVLTTDNRVAGDQLVINRSSSFDTKNVGSSKPISVYSVSLSDPSGLNTIDASNYVVSATGATSGNVSRLNSVAWTGGGSGNWHDPSKWAGGAIPDLANVANVTVPSGATITFNDTPTGLAQSGEVIIDSLSASGSILSQTAGTLRIAGNTNLGGFQQSGGITNITGNFATTSGFTQGTSGSLSVGGASTLASTASPIVLGNFSTTGALAITSNGGSITQAAGTAVEASSTTSLFAQNSGVDADITLNNLSNRWVGLLNVSRAANLALRGTVLSLQNFTTSGSQIFNSAV
jgi:hypothetical protein